MPWPLLNGQRDYYTPRGVLRCEEWAHTARKRRTLCAPVLVMAIVLNRTKIVPVYGGACDEEKIQILSEV
jgi:hypothetical protein